MTATNSLIEAAAAAASRIEAAAAELGSSFHANQDCYGVDFEVLTGGEWVRRGDLEDGAAVKAVRLFDCDGERGATCQTPAAVERDAARWVEALEIAAVSEQAEFAD